MALITCPECQQQVSDQATACPKCGYPLTKEPIPVSESVDDSAATTTEKPIPEIKEQQKSSKNKRIVIACVAVACVVVLAVVGFIVKQNSDKAARAEYIANLNSFLYESLAGAADAESACNLTYKVWYDTIHENYRSETVAYTKTNGTFNDDFNTSLSTLYSSSEMLATIATIEDNQATVDELYKALQNPTEEFTSCFVVVDDLYSAYYKLTSLAVSPTGSLNSYSADFSDYDSEYMEHYDKLKLLIPEE